MSDYRPDMTLGEALNLATRRLTAAGVPGAARDARRLAAFAVGCNAASLAGRLRDPLGLAADRFEAAISLREDRTPVSHIMGLREFWGREFTVDERVLDPRPETECLIAQALTENYSAILDLGTGSGSILLTLLAENHRATGTGTDISVSALEVAERNAVALGVNDRCRFLCADWFEGVGGEFDLIVSNPPYIAASELQDLQPEVLEHEPRSALTDGNDGLSAYRAIGAAVPPYLKPGGRLIVEIGPTQAAEVVRFFSKAGLEEIAVHPDLDGRDRVVSARKPA